MLATHRHERRKDEHCYYRSIRGALQPQLLVRSNLIGYSRRREARDIAEAIAESKRCIASDMPESKPTLSNMSTWIDRLGHSRWWTFTDEKGRFWIEQNSAKASRWPKLAREGHTMAWVFETPGGSYTGRILINGEAYSTSEATKRFLNAE